MNRVAKNTGLAEVVAIVTALTVVPTKAASEAIRTVAGASKYLRGCQLGFFGVLHIWGRDVAVYHPHVHFVVPGGGVNEAEGVWQQTPENFFLPHAALSKVYKAKFADHLRASGLYDQVEASAWTSTDVMLEFGEDIEVGNPLNMACHFCQLCC